jgi:hypothetical protein
MGLRISFCVGLITLALVRAYAAQAETGLESLASEIQQFLDEKSATGPSANPRSDPARGWLAQLRTGIARNNRAEIESALLQLPTYLDSAPIRQHCEEVVAKLKSERDAEEKSLSDQVEKALQHASAVVRSATKPEELDPVLQELSRLRDEKSKMTPSAAPRPNCEEAVRFVRAWQDYLSQAAAGDISGAKKTLENLRDRLGADLIPRSEILRRIQARPEVAFATPAPAREEMMKGILVRAKTLNDLNGTIAELEK